MEIPTGTKKVKFYRRQNIDKFIPEDTRRKCYFDWVKVRRCASKNLGETFASKINFTRQLEDEQQSYDELVDYYEGHYLDRERQIKLELTKPDEEFEDIVEEADDGAEAEAVEE